MSEPNSESQKIAEPLSHPALKQLVQDLSLFKREEVCRTIPSIREISESVPYNVTEIGIDCSDSDSYTFHIYDHKFSLKIDKEKMYKRKDHGPWETIRSYSDNIGETFEMLAKTYVGQSSGSFKCINIRGLLPAWNIEKRLTIEHLYIEDTSEDVDREAVFKFLDQVTNVKDITCCLMKRGDLLNHHLFKAQPFNLTVTDFKADIFRLIRASGTSIHIRFLGFYNDRDFENFAQELVESDRPIGFFLTMAAANGISFEMIQNIWNRSNKWRFTPHNNKLALSYAHSNRDILLTHDVLLDLIRMEIVPLNSIRSFDQLDSKGLIDRNTSIQQLSYEERKRKKEEIPWEPSIPHVYSSIEVDFDSFKLDVDGRKSEYGSVKETLEAVLYLFCNWESIAINLTIMGSAEYKLTESSRKLYAKHITLKHSGVYPEKFFKMFGWMRQHGSLETLTIPSMESMKNEDILLHRAARVQISGHDETVLETDGEPEAKLPKLDHS